MACLNPLQAAPTYTVVGTGQTRCYDDRGEITPPRPGQPFFGQDAQHPKPAPQYKDNADGTVSDLNTGLTWVKARGQKMTWDDAVAGAAKCRAGGFSDWRMPAIKDLYSLIDFNGGCGGTVANSKPYLDTNYFDFAYGDESKGVRLIDCQDWSATQYVGKTMHGNPTVFGVNFADGRIKGYPKSFPGGRSATLYVRYVRGNPAYGVNDFHDNGDGSITDAATGLTWPKADSGTGMNWRDALAWVQKKNGEKYLGHTDWRLPNAKELQSIVDYTRAPSETHSAAISPLFEVTKLSDGEYPFFWTSTTHLEGPPFLRGQAAVYIAFGRATGWMQPHSGPPGAHQSGPRSNRPGMGPPPFGGPGQGPPPGFGPPEGSPPGESNPPEGGPPQGGPLDASGPQKGFGQRQGLGPPSSGADGQYQLLDVHGAGAQRSDPKTGNPKNFPHGRGPQGDVIRILNHVRCVRGGSS